MNPSSPPLRIPALLAAIVVSLAGTLSGHGKNPPTQPADGIWRILPIGDSITEGGSSFSNWRFRLWEKLTASGYFIRYTGTRTSKSRIGPLAHEGHGGKNAEFIARHLHGMKEPPAADIVLLHAGHNHFAHENPVAGIVAAHESIIATCRDANPQVTILLARVIPSSKLPKYSYIPALNKELTALAGRLDRKDSRVVIVDQAAGFDPVSDTVDDGVHPNESGAEKIAKRWFESLREVLPAAPDKLQMPRLLPYKETAKGPLMLHVFQPPGRSDSAPSPAVVFFFGGGWTQGTPLQFYPECRHLASRGRVAIAADYRTASSHGTSPFDAVADARSAIRYLRSHAAELGIDPGRIVAAGASAGGHLAAATACIWKFDDPADDRGIDARPNALMLWYPVIDNGPGGYGHDRIGDKFPDFSPMHNIRPGFPPTLFLLGTRDKSIPVATGKAFQREIEEAGSRCDLHLFPGAGHPIYNYRDPSAAKSRADVLKLVDAFLKPM